MAASQVATVSNGLRILMEMAADGRPLSRTALRQRCGLGATRLNEALRFLTQSGLVARRKGPRGPYHLVHPPEKIKIGVLSKAAGPPSTGPLLPGLDRRTTLADLTTATDSYQNDICPYYDACVAFGGPAGPGTADYCTGDHEW